MRKTTSKLVAGDVMGSGEIVISCEKSTGFGQSNPKGRIVLKNLKTGKTRVASWNWWGTVFLSGKPDLSGGRGNPAELEGVGGS